MIKVGFVSLGCSKNLVDTEMIIGNYKEKGYEIVNNPAEAEIIVINTCGFIEAAKQEAIDTILEMADFKKTGNCKTLIVTGCLVERYKSELEEALPEVDLFVPIREYENYFKDLISTGSEFAYLKIAEGCSNNCTYCAIPLIRGPYISRPMDDILKEAKLLEEKGIKEIIVIAQDTTKYGIDLYGESKLAELLKELCKFDFKWIRFLYSYPETISDELIQVVKDNDKICNYFDIPIQHISDNVLKRMGRKSNGQTIRDVVSKIRKEIPNVILRTSLIVGFPGETKEQFNELADFVREAKFNRLGVFKYSMEDGTPAVKLKGHMEDEIKQERYEIIMEEQQNVSANNNNMLIEREIECVIEGITDDSKYYYARSYMDVPDTDGFVFVKNDKVHNVGEFVTVRICDAMEYDVFAVEI